MSIVRRVVQVMTSREREPVNTINSTYGSDKQYEDVQFRKAVAALCVRIGFGCENPVVEEDVP